MSTVGRAEGERLERGKGPGMELELTSDQEMFASTTRKFLDERVPASELRARRDDPVGFDRAYWAEGADLGWTSLLVSEADGGGSISDRSYCDIALLGYEFGRRAAPGPLAETNVVAGAISRLGTDAQKAAVLPGILSGEVLAGWCAAEPRPHDRLGVVTLQATPRGGGFELNGRKQPVESADQAGWFLVVAKTPEGLSQLLVAADAPGVTISPMGGVDLSRRFGTVSFDGVVVDETAVLGELGEAEPEIECQLHGALVIELAQMVGAIEAAFDMTVEWAFNRYSFGRPLASYQALKHRFADMKLWLETSHALADDAARAVQDDMADAAEIVSAAKAFVSAKGPEVLQECVQLHGGIGVTFDHDLHLFLRRVVLGAQLFGTVADHRERLVQILEQKEVHA
jgi:alkylation response protein AidB-like acyl-CoA dehydrogenase